MILKDVTRASSFFICPFLRQHFSRVLCFLFECSGQFHRAQCRAQQRWLSSGSHSILYRIPALHLAYAGPGRCAAHVEGVRAAFSALDVVDADSSRLELSRTASAEMSNVEDT